MSFACGVAFSVLKIAWIVLVAVYLYDISVDTGQFELMNVVFRFVAWHSVALCSIVGVIAMLYTYVF